ncbi:hypothetical protein [Arenimonas sp. GDDSR-1]|uniref:hypothetical protein n=1 Tax=Arenimonas sp. GDDSR-1 TaxID=2950125 RepID=UPI00262CCB65|nr:hypothetical protein [Arenimonas sp. GDDSR-1]
MPIRRALLLFAIVSVIRPALAAPDAAVLQQALARNLPEPAVQALAAIPDPGRKLLAARSYYRAQASLEKRWSWSEARIQAYEGSAEQKQLLAEIARIGEHFSSVNPGYSLYANTKVRSLDRQIAVWNENASVGSASAQLMSALDADAGMKIEAGNPQLPTQLKSWLGAHSPAPGPNVAAPGLSAHGQMHAVDFQISQNGSLIAPADSAKVATVWRAQGWDAKLKASIKAAGPAFEGPLTSPDEPWHYSYSPAHEETGHVEISP